MTKFRKTVESLLENTYEKPYNPEEILKIYGEDTYNKLMKDPCHNWRAETGIELIHKEPTEQEFDRIWNNWQLMPNEDKEKSDAKSIELFGVDNKTHYEQLKNQYKQEYLKRLAAEREEDQEEIYSMYRRSNKFLEAIKEETNQIINQNSSDYDKNEYNIYLNKVKKDGLNELLNVPEKFKDYNMCKLAIENTLLYVNLDYDEEYLKNLLQAIPQKLLNFENSDLYSEIVKMYAPMLKLIPDKAKDYNMCLEAVKENPQVLEFVPEDLMDYNICLTGVKEYGWALEYIPDKFKDYNMYLEAVIQDGRCIKYVPEKFKDYRMCIKSVENGPYYGDFLEQVPEKFRDYNMWLAMIIKNGDLIKYVPQKFRDKKMILNTFRTNSSALNYDKDYGYFDIDSNGNINLNSHNDFMNKLKDFKL